MSPQTFRSGSDRIVLFRWLRAMARPMNGWVIALILVGAIIGIGAIIMNADRLTLEECAALTRDGERLTCFDQLAKQERHWPAKGAVMPRHREGQM